ncbi:hypothetical protein D3C75_1061870 [compost metagenome]
MAGPRQIEAGLDGLGHTGLADAASDSAAQTGALAGGDAEGFQPLQAVGHQNIGPALDGAIDQGDGRASGEGGGGELMPVARAVQGQEEVARLDFTAVVGQARNISIGSVELAAGRRGDGFGGPERRLGVRHDRAGLRSLRWRRRRDG